jgi:hypothetical protein
MLKINQWSVVLAALLLSQSAGASAEENCASIVKSAQDAAGKADWVIEGNIADVIRIGTRTELSVDGAKILYERERSTRFSTVTLPVDSCFPNGAASLLGKGGDKLIGKRMRFFGTRLQSGVVRRLFYMQPEEQAMPRFPPVRKEYVTAAHPPVAMKKASDGWTRARSTEGGFSIEMPGPFVDLTKADGGEPAFILRGSDKYGATFIAVFERAGPDSGMGGTFDSTIGKPGAKVAVFKGAEAVYTVGELPGKSGKKLSYGLWFRVPGGTYMLGVVTDKAHEAESLKARERFFNSLAFE